MLDKTAIILCSGGIDSVVTAYYTKRVLGYKRLKIVFFDYGQRSLINEEFFSKLCGKNIGADFIKIRLNWLSEISNSLINKNKKVKKISKKNLKDTKKESEKYYVPCRNLLFLSYALALAESIYIKEKKDCDIFVGFKCEGEESYPDTTNEFVRRLNNLSEKGCSGNFKIIAPLIKKDKEDIIILGKKLGVDFRKTFSCYISDKKKKHCGKCLACALRKSGFYWAGKKDPTDYLEN
ncbi:7-cyano-7-deazaguanine synthase [Candidatus Pacearchaeota archaeon]|nr:7-cyano-7-deazaguanine synthase [Candidatus Pacearchaeota archaeon]